MDFLRVLDYWHPVTMPFQVSLRVTAAGGLAAVLAVTTEVIVVTTLIPSQFQDAGANSADAALVTSETQQLERDIFALVNQHRMALQLPAFLPDDVCANEARAHSVNMAAGRTPLGHEGFQERISRIAAHGGGGNQAGENTAAAQTTAVAIVQGWLSEPDFKRNIEGGSRISGVGVARSNAGTNFFTQIYF
jgi:uncharacterized protein YkwD